MNVYSTKCESGQAVQAQNRPVSWTVRPYRRGDESQVVRLFRATFGRPMTEAQYRWKVVDSRWPVAAPNIWLAEAGDEIIGQYAGTPMRFKIEDEEIRLLHVCDGMTASGFRRQGVLTALAMAAHQAWAKAGVPFVVGLPYGSWGSRRQYFRWQELYEIMWMWRPLRPEQFIHSRAPRFSSLTPAVSVAGKLWNAVWDSALQWSAQGVEVRPMPQPDLEFDVLWNNLRSRYQVLAVRDQAWVAYRYAQAPEFGYRLLLATRKGRPVGYLAYRLSEQGRRRTGWIADLFTAPEDDTARAGLLRAAIRTLRAAGADEVRALVPRNTAAFASFRRAGFWTRPGSFKTSIVALAQEVPYHLLQDPSRWFMMGGDFDVI